MDNTPMGTDLTTPKYDPGSAMAALPPDQAAFVEAMIEGGAGPTAVAAAAAKAGYSSNYGWTLMRKPRVLAAIREEAAKALLGGALLAQKVLIEIATDVTHKDRLKAAKELLAHSGFIPTTEQKITVEHVNSTAAQLVTEIKEFARVTGLDARQLLGGIGITTEPVDVEFEEVDDDAWSV